MSTKEAGAKMGAHEKALMAQCSANAAVMTQRFDRNRGVFFAFMLPMIPPAGVFVPHHLCVWSGLN